MIFFRKLKSLI